jgi:hypothetical protein
VLSQAGAPLSCTSGRRRDPTDRCGNERTRSFHSRYTCCNVCIASGTNVYASSCKERAAVIVDEQTTKYVPGSRRDCEGASQIEGEGDPLLLNPDGTNLIM